MYRIDINSDLGECNDEKGLKRELAILPLISSVNVCCGFHSGKLEFIEQVIEEAVRLGINIGAHPSYPDRAGFGRRAMDIASPELKNLLMIQIEKIRTLATKKGGKMTYVKAHGALYNKIMDDPSEAGLLVEVLKDLGGLALMGLPNTVLEELATKSGLRYIREGFIDRVYTKKGRLLPRFEPDSVIESDEDAIIQAGLMIKEQFIFVEGEKVPMTVDSLCVHGDHVNTASILAAMIRNFKDSDIEIISFD
jgi:5-oxoprolinase (ATP-hydrolysing) subunit A